MRFNIVQLCAAVLLMIGLVKALNLLPWKKTGVPSICQKIVKKTITTNIPYLETYWSYEMGVPLKPNMRINYRTVHSIRSILEDKCCDGFREELYMCTPICSPQCKYGTCEEPNVCECLLGYEKSTEESNVCKPICSNGCINGDCVMPEVCQCYPNYWLDSDGYTCRATCTEGCDVNHGYCLLPDTCICRNGYQKVAETHICEPICEQECINGRCILPNICHCDNGYEKDYINIFNCKPICEKSCFFGTCTAPNVCNCSEGYRLNDNAICEPICSQQCFMGTCIAPDVCTCNDGYKMKDASSSICEPMCKNGCINGTCIAPNTCHCNEGFILDDRGSFGWATCKPFCTLSCGTNAECIAPDLCTCQQGYRRVNANDTTNDLSHSKNISCRPTSENDCINGKCIASNVCDVGYEVWISNGTNVNYYCLPYCEKDCGPNGKCDAPNFCLCDEGYYKKTTMTDQYVCQPFCELSCENGTCTRPNTCTCYIGYERNNNYLCVPSCESSCDNGTCIEPNLCACDEGFVEQKNGNVSVCVPVCSHNCSGHGVCLDGLDNFCHCSFGWTGRDCEKENVCVYKTTANSTLLFSVTVINEMNSSLLERYNNAPLCYQCSDSLDNETLCLSIQSDESLTIPTVGCFLSTDFPCYKRQHSSALKGSSGITEYLVVVAIIIIMLTAMASYAIIYKRRRKSVILNEGQASILQPEATEGSIIEDQIYL